jgi:hypothetical protein
MIYIGSVADLEIDWRLILKWIVKKKNGSVDVTYIQVA